MDGAHHLPGAGHLHVARVLACRQPPPRLRRAGDHDPAVALLLRASPHADVHQFEVLPLRLEPKIDGVFLLRLVLVVKVDVWEPAIAFHAAHDLDLVEHEMEIGVELRIAEHEGAVLGALVDHLLHRGVDVLLGEILGLACRGGACLGRNEVLRLLDVGLGVLDEGLLRFVRRKAIDLAVGGCPIHRAVGLHHLAIGKTHGAGIVELALDRRD